MGINYTALFFILLHFLVVFAWPGAAVLEHCPLTLSPAPSHPEVQSFLGRNFWVRGIAS